MTTWARPGWSRRAWLHENGRAALVAIPTGRAATHDGQVAELDLEPEALAERGNGRHRILGTDLPTRSTLLAVEVPVVCGRSDVEFFAPVAAVCVPDDPQVFQNAQGPIDRRGRRFRIERPAALDKFASRHVTVSLREDVEQHPTLRRPAKAVSTQVVADRCCGGFDD